MGKVISSLARTRLPRQTIFGDRFVVECCESFHVHFRNLRLELDRRDFERVMAALAETARTWEANGKPVSHPHLELGRAEVNGSDEGVFSIELCENLYKKWPTGWDARFHREDSFVHVHWRDFRLEMSNAEFLALAETTEIAARKLRAWKLETLSEIFERLDAEGVVYAVIRNWENLPDGVETGPHSDLDLLVHPDHEDRFDSLLDVRHTTDDPDRVQQRIDVMGPEGPSYVLADVRVPGDGYFPDELAYGMLARRIRHRGFWVLDAADHQIGLAYHIVHHKGFATGDYWVKLAWLAGHSGLPAPDDADCTRYAVGLLETAGVPPVDCDDGTVRPVLPLLYPRATLVTSRFLAMHDGGPVFSRVYVVPDGDGKRVIKQTTGDLAGHEYEVLRMIRDPRVPSVAAFEAHPGHGSFVEEHIDGTRLDEAGSIVRGWRFEEARAFAAALVDIGALLASHGVRHRDIRAENLLVRDDLPVLIDFGWAETEERLLDEPAGGWLGGAARCPEGGPCDAYSVGYVLSEQLAAAFPELEPIAEELMECRSGEIPDWDALRDRVESLEEQLPDFTDERFARLAERGRYDEARAVDLDTDALTGDAAFWYAHLAIQLGADVDRELLESIAPPEAVASCPAVSARVVSETLEALEPDHPLPDHLRLLIAPHLDAESVPLSIVDCIASAFARLASVLDADRVRSAFERAGRRDEWTALRACALLEAGDERDRDAFLAELERSGLEPLVPAAAALAELYAKAGRSDRAVALARFVMDNDPHAESCARILAEHADVSDGDALAAWRTVRRLVPDDAAARARVRRLRRVANREGGPATPLPEDAGALVPFVRRSVAEGRLADAVRGATRLAEIATPGDPGPAALLEKLRIMRNQKRGHIRIVVDPLGENTYEPDPGVMHAELEAIVETPFGTHPIVRAAHREVTGASAVTRS